MKKKEPSGEDGRWHDPGMGTARGKAQQSVAAPMFSLGKYGVQGECTGEAGRGLS